MNNPMVSIRTDLMHVSTVGQNASISTSMVQRKKKGGVMAQSRAGYIMNVPRRMRCTCSN